MLLTQHKWGPGRTLQCEQRENQSISLAGLEGQEADPGLLTGCFMQTTPFINLQFLQRIVTPL